MDQAVAPKPGPYRFKPRRQKEGGRRLGSTNEVPRLLKDAIILAAELEGSNGQGSDKLLGFFRKVAREDPRGFVKLLGRVLPLQVEKPTAEVREEVPYKSVDEVRRELVRRGITVDLVARILQDPAEVIDDEGVEMVDAKG